MPQRHKGAKTYNNIDLNDSKIRQMLMNDENIIGKERFSKNVFCKSYKSSPSLSFDKGEEENDHFLKIDIIT